MKTITVALLALCLGVVLLSVEARRSGKKRSHTGNESDSDEIGTEEKLFVSDENIPDCKCSKKLRPVCGSDRKTYKNECTLKCKKDKDDPTLRIKRYRSCDNINSDGDTSESGSSGDHTDKKKHKGSSNDKNKENVIHGCNCSSKKRTVCGMDGVTYRNECLMRCYSKREFIRKDRNGPCNEDHGHKFSLFGFGKK